MPGHEEGGAAIDVGLRPLELTSIFVDSNFAIGGVVDGFTETRLLIKCQNEGACMNRCRATDAGYQFIDGASDRGGIKLVHSRWRDKTLQQYAFSDMQFDWRIEICTHLDLAGGADLCLQAFCSEETQLPPIFSEGIVFRALEFSGSADPGVRAIVRIGGQPEAPLEAG